MAPVTRVIITFLQADDGKARHGWRWCSKSRQRLAHCTSTSSLRTESFYFDSIRFPSVG